MSVCTSGHGYDGPMSLLRASVTADALGSNYGGANPALLTDATGWSTSNDGGPDTPTLTYVPAASLPAPSPIGMGGAAKVTYTGSNNNNSPFPAALNIPHLGLVFGVTYTVSLWIYMPSGTADPANTGITDLSMVASNASSTTNMSGQRDQWVQVSATFTANSFPILAMWTGPSAVAGQFFYATGVLIQPGADQGNFCLGGGADGDPAPVLVDGADTVCTANGLAHYTPSPGDRLLVQRVGGAVEVVQFLSRGRTPWLTSDDYTDLTTQISTAQTAANNAQTTADGKNTVHYSTGTPGSTANIAGDIWFQYDGSDHVIGQWKGEGGTTWASVALSHEVIASIDLGTATVGQLNAAQVVIGDATNLVKDPSMDGIGSWSTSAAWSYVAPGTQAPGDDNNQVIRWASASAYSQIAEAEFPVTPGEKFYAEYYVRRASGTVATAGTLGALVFFYDNTGTFIGTGGSVDTSAASLTTTAWLHQSGEVTAPANAVKAQVVIRGTAAVNGAGSYDFDLVRVKRKATGDLIVDGAIDGQTITGAVLQTASSGNRLVVHDNGTEGLIEFYGGVSGETPCRVYGDNGGGSLTTLNLNSGSTPTETKDSQITMRPNSDANGNITLTADKVYLNGMSLGSGRGLSWGSTGGEYGRPMQGWDFNTESVTTDSTGTFTVNHSLLATPTVAFCTSQTATNLTFRITAINSTSISFRAYDVEANAYHASASFSVAWCAFLGG